MPENKKWTEQHQKRYIWLYNWLTSEQDIIKIPKPLNKDNYLAKITITTLIKAIKDNSKWGASSKESIYFMIARWFEVNDPKNNEIEYIKNWDLILNIKEMKKKVKMNWMKKKRCITEITNTLQIY